LSSILKYLMSYKLWDHFKVLYYLLKSAIEDEADFIEADIVASKDGHLVCFHDVTLDATTDIANWTEFADRKRTYEVERVTMTGFFVGM